MRVSTFMKEFFVKNKMCGAENENDISLYIAHKAITINYPYTQ